MLFGEVVSRSEDFDDAPEPAHEDVDSSDMDWIPAYEDAVESSDSDFEVDIVDES